MFALVKGRKFGAWVDADSRDNGYNENDLIENPAYIIESILRDELGLTSSSINYASFDDVGNTTDGRRDDWKMRKSISSQQNSRTIVGEVCQNSGIVAIHDFSNLERVVALDHYAPSDELTTADIVFDSGKPQVRVRQTHAKYIYNEFFLNYALNSGSGNYDKQLYITAAGQNLATNTRSDKTYTTYGGAGGLCDGSQEMYNVVRRWTWNSDWIADDTTAELFIKLMADWLAIRRWEVEATLWYNATTLKLEAMDQVTWDLDLLPISIRNEQVADLAGTPVTSGGSLADDTYYYVVTAIDPYGEGKLSNETAETITGGGGAGKVNLTWTDIADATLYRVYRGTTSGSYTGYYETATNSFTDTGAAFDGTGEPLTVPCAFFISNVIDYGLKGGGRIKMSFQSCPLFF
jgi:hypothetical protein